MMGERSTAAQDATPNESIYQAAAALARKGDYGTLILDGLGKIRSCGTAAAELLGCSLGELAGKPISAVIPGFALSGTSLSYSVRYIAHMCADCGWRQFAAIDARGIGFSIDLAISRVSMDGEDLFLLNMRRSTTA